MAELALDDVQRHALTGQLERVRVTQLVRREAPPDTGAGRPAVRRTGGTRCERRRLTRSPTGRAIDDAEERSDGSAAVR